MSLTLFVAALASVNPTADEGWRRVFERGGYEVYVDRSRMEPLVGGAWRAPLRIELPAPAPAADGWPAHRSIVEVRRIDCTRKVAGLESREVFAKANLEGAPLRGVRMKEVTLEAPPPGTVGAAVLLAVCRAVGPSRDA